MFSHSMPPRGSDASKFTEVLDKSELKPDEVSIEPKIVEE